MSYFDEVYLKRLNKYGLDYQTRIQNKREQEFENYLLKSIYRLNFLYEGDMHPATLEPKKEDNTELVAYLLTRVDLNIPNGTILMLEDKDRIERPWMIYWLESMKASGYNRYTVLRMTHFLTWKNRADETCSTWAYFYGQEDNMLKDELKSRSRSNVLYTENLKLSFFVTSRNVNIRKDDYIEIGTDALKEGYRVTGYDIQSTPGVEFVSVDPVYIYDQTPPPVKPSGDTSDDYFWLNQ